MRQVLMLSNISRSFPGYAEVPGLLAAAGYGTIDPGARFVPQEELVPLIRDVEGVLVGGLHELRGPVLRAARNLKAVVREGIGVDNIDLDVATSLGIVVSNTAGSNANSVADHAFLLMLALARDVLRLDRETRAGQGWSNWVPLEQIGGRTIGVLGTGNVGSAVVRRAAGFGMTILANDLVPDARLVAEHGVRYVPLQEMIESADILTLHVPLTELTRHIIGRRELAAMKPTAILVNTARGEVLDDDALLEVLRAGRLAGAAIDVWTTEPVREHPLFALPNVIVTPHVGGNSRQSSFNARTFGVRNLLEALAGRPRDVVNPEVLGAHRLASPTNRPPVTQQG